MPKDYNQKVRDAWLKSEDIKAWVRRELERIFSQVNLVKSKLRYKIELSTINSALYKRYGLRRLQKCSYTYTVPNKYLHIIRTGLCYDSQDPQIDDIINIL